MQIPKAQNLNFQLLLISETYWPYSSTQCSLIKVICNRVHVQKITELTVGNGDNKVKSLEAHYYSFELFCSPNAIGHLPWFCFIHAIRIAWNGFFQGVSSFTVIQLSRVRFCSIVLHVLLPLKLFIFLSVKGLASVTSCKQLVKLFDQNLMKLEMELNSPDFLSKGAAQPILESTI